MKVKLFLLFLLFSLSLGGCGTTSYLEDTTKKADSDGGTESVEEYTDEIYVQIDGAVKKPGVYKLPADSRVFLLIEKAGGLKSDAADSELNQAELLTDGQKITVLTKKELKSRQKEASDPVDGDGRVDLNRADEQTLTTISGIGPSKAAAIIAYREEHGPFKKTEDITKVSGIGAATYRRIKDKITV